MQEFMNYSTPTNVSDRSQNSEVESWFLDGKIEIRPNTVYFVVPGNPVLIGDSQFDPDSPVFISLLTMANQKNPSEVVEIISLLTDVKLHVNLNSSTPIITI